MVPVALADRDIVLLSGNANKVTIYDDTGYIYISDGDASTFVFECFDDVTEDPADIVYIGLTGTPSGTVTIQIAPGAGHTYGAASVYEIDLTATGVTGVIAGMNISGNLAADGDVSCDSVTGDIFVGFEHIQHDSISATSIHHPRSRSPRTSKARSAPTRRATC